jgi:hypothetical protein
MARVPSLLVTRREHRSFSLVSSHTAQMAHKSTELRRRPAHHHHDDHVHPSHKVASSLGRDATGDTIDVTDAGLLLVSPPGVIVLI